MTRVRFSCALSPDIEERILNQQDLEIIADFLLALKDKTTPLKDHLLVFLPAHLKSYLNGNLRLKVAWNRLQSGDTQSRFSMVYPAQHDECETNCVAPLFGAVTPESSSRLIINLLHNAKFPIILSDKNASVAKDACNTCLGIKVCGEPFKMASHNLPNDLSSLKDIQKSTLSLFENIGHLNFATLTEEQFRVAMLLMCISQDVPDSKIQNMENIFITSGFMSDIQAAHGTDIKNIAFSAFRASSFPAFDNRKEASHFSIDWHQENPNSVDGISLFRCDVVFPHERGKAHSGTKRLLFCHHQNLKAFLAYTPDHDFSEDLIRQRIKLLHDEYAELQRRKMKVVTTN